MTLSLKSGARRVPARSARANLWQRAAARAVLGALGRIRDGELEVRERNRTIRLGSPAADGLRGIVEVSDPRFHPALLLRGGLGAGESYVDGHWSSPSLTDVVRVLARNREALESFRGNARRLTAPLLRLLAATRRNTRAGSRRNIVAHYDLGNPFFRLLLDDTMTYSCGVFDSPRTSLRDAQIAKLERICRHLALAPGQRVLEIGTGWGSFALHAAARHGVHVTTTTISPSQRAEALARVRAAGLEDRITVLDRDYRDLQGRYDRVVSIEMIEAVGAEYLPAFFETCARHLTPDGRAVVQAITIEDDRFEEARRTVDFIKRYVFPGSCIPSMRAMRAAMAPAGLELTGVDDITPHYPTTLAAWRRRLFASRDRLPALGLDERFLRTWEFYLSYCEGGFLERRIGTVQMTLRACGGGSA